MIDMIAELAAIDRETGRGKLPAGDARSVTVRRRYDAAIEDVWDALTTAERISRWFLPVSGDLQPVGRYQLGGNAGGEIVRCEPPGAVGVGWDLAALGLGLHLASGEASVDDKAAWGKSDEARLFMRGSSEAWGEAYLESGGSPDEVAAMVAATSQFYAPDPAS